MGEQHPLTVCKAPDRERAALEHIEAVVPSRLRHADDSSNLIELAAELPRFPGEIAKDCEDGQQFDDDDDQE
jgi:hypothetical protein